MISTQTLRDIRANGQDSVIGTTSLSYDAIVVDTNDPENLHRIKVECPEILGNGNVSNWAYFEGTFAGDGYGIFILPQLGDNVKVRTATGGATITDNNPLIWYFGEVANGEKPPEATNNAYTIIMPNGSRFKIDFESNDSPISIVHASENKIEIDGTKINIEHNAGHTINVDSSAIVLEHLSGSKVEVGATTITVENTIGNKLELSPTNATLESVLGGIFEANALVRVGNNISTLGVVLTAIIGALNTSVVLEQPVKDLLNTILANLITPVFQ